jgi:predicted dehydrogenase
MNRYMALAKSLRVEGLAEVVAACDINPERAAIMRDLYQVHDFTTQYRALIERDDVDVILVLTAMQAHGEITRAALEAGKHVLVEKPMSSDLGQAAELVQMAKTSRGLLMAAPHIILSQTYQTMWRRLRRGDIGRVLSARARYGWAGPSWGRWFYQKGGGVLFDLGVYNLVALTGFIGPVKRVMAMTGVSQPDRIVEGSTMTIEAEDTAHVLLDFGADVFAVVSTGFTMQKYRSPAIELYGTTGTLQMLGDDWDPDGYELWQNDVGAWQVYEETDPSWPWTDGLRHLCECIRNGTRPLNTPEHAFHVIEVMQMAQASGRDGMAKTIQSTFAPLAIDGGEISAAGAHLIHDRQ